MKYIYILFTLIFCLYFCKHKPKEVSLSDNFKFQTNSHFFLKEDYCKKFIKDFIELPECKNTKFFGIFIDQRYDTLILTMIKYPKYNKFYYFLGYFEVDKKYIVINSPFTKLFNIKVDSLEYIKLSKLYYDEIKTLKKNWDQKKIIWQLKVCIFNNEYYILKDTSKIYNTLSGPYKILKDTLP